MNTTNQILLEWPVIAEPYNESSPTFPASAYVPPPAPSSNFVVTTAKYRMVAPTVVLEMAKWIEIVEKGLKKSKTEPTMLTERDPIADQQNLEAPLPIPQSSLLREVDPVAHQQPLHTQQTSQPTYQFNNVEQVIVQSENFASNNQIPQWKEIDPMTGRPVESASKTSQPPKDDVLSEELEVAGWKMV